MVYEYTDRQIPYGDKGQRGFLKYLRCLVLCIRTAGAGWGPHWHPQQPHATYGSDALLSSALIFSR